MVTDGGLYIPLRVYFLARSHGDSHIGMHSSID